MRYCKNCGAEINGDASFCSDCGQKVERASEILNSDVSVYCDTSSIKERNIVVALILTFITFGIYSIYWMYKINNESLALAKEKGERGGNVILLYFLTFGLYGFYWWYKMGICSDKISENKGNYSVIYILLSFLGVGIANYVIAQNIINNNVEKI
jgi:hypothetical protein